MHLLWLFKNPTATWAFATIQHISCQSYVLDDHTLDGIDRLRLKGFHLMHMLMTTLGELCCQAIIKGRKVFHSAEWIRRNSTVKSICWINIDPSTLCVVSIKKLNQNFIFESAVRDRAWRLLANDYPTPWEIRLDLLRFQCPEITLTL